MGALRLLSQYRPPPGPLPNPREFKPIPVILNWLAHCFAREPDDEVATTLYTPGTSVVIYVVNTRGPPDERDKTNAASFLSTVRETWNQSPPEIATSFLKTIYNMA